jgi:hypothetical protein
MDEYGARDPVELTIIATCGSGTCPTIYRTSRQTIIVQGTAIPAESVDVELGPDESLVEIPERLLSVLLADRERPAP